MEIIATTLTADQQIRIAAVHAAATVADPRDGTFSEMVHGTLLYADQIAAYIRDGQAT